MVQIKSEYNERFHKISSEKNSSSECEKCISDILNRMVSSELTYETAYAVLDECKNRLSVIHGQLILTNPH